MTWASFFESNTFVGLATLLAAISAYLVFLKEKRVERQNAAKILLTEIKNSEAVINDLIKKKADGSLGSLDDFIIVLPTNSWNKYSYLFQKVLDAEEASLITDFYSSCEVIQSYLDKQFNFFWITTEERAKISEQLPANLAAEIYRTRGAGAINSAVVNDFINTALDAYYKSNTQYRPAKIMTALNSHLDRVKFVSNTICWQKLKNVASPTWWQALANIIRS